MGQITYDDFLNVDVRVGTITRVEPAQASFTSLVVHLIFRVSFL